MRAPLSGVPSHGRSALWFGAILLLAGTVAFSGCRPALTGGGAAGGHAPGKSEGGAGGNGSDALITMRVKAKLLADSEVRGLKIDVDTNLGTVTLSGVAESQDEIDRAVEIAKTVGGVKSVESNLKLREDEEEEPKEEG